MQHRADSWDFHEFVWTDWNNNINNSFVPSRGPDICECAADDVEDSEVSFETLSKITPEFEYFLKPFMTSSVFAAAAAVFIVAMLNSMLLLLWTTCWRVWHDSWQKRINNRLKIHGWLHRQKSWVCKLSKYSAATQGRQLAIDMNAAGFRGNKQTVARFDTQGNIIIHGIDGNIAVCWSVSRWKEKIFFFLTPFILHRNVTPPANESQQLPTEKIQVLYDRHRRSQQAKEEVLLKINVRWLRSHDVVGFEKIQQRLNFQVHSHYRITNKSR